MFDEINYNNLRSLSLEYQEELLMKLSTYIYLAYIEDWTRHVLVTGKGLTNLPNRSIIGMKEFPKNTKEFDRFVQKYELNRAINQTIKKGSEEKVSSKSVMKKGLSTVGKTKLNICLFVIEVEGEYSFSKRHVFLRRGNKHDGWTYSGQIHRRTIDKICMAQVPLS